MKKTGILLMICVLLLALVGCGSNGNNNNVETVTDSKQEETTETVNEPLADKDKSDEQLIAETKEQLLGEWYCPSIELEHLVFNEDGTGHYTGIDRDHDFTYSFVVDRLETTNNGRDIEYIMTVTYDTGDVEEIRFIIGDEGISGNPGDTKMLFQTPDHGGYSGVMNYFDPWVKK